MKLYSPKGSKRPCVINLEHAEGFEQWVFTPGNEYLNRWVVKWLGGMSTDLTREDCIAITPLIGMNLLEIEDPYDPDHPYNPRAAREARA